MNWTYFWFGITVVIAVVTGLAHLTKVLEFLQLRRGGLVAKVTAVSWALPPPAIEQLKKLDQAARIVSDFNEKPSLVWPQGSLSAYRRREADEAIDGLMQAGVHQATYFGAIDGMVAVEIENRHSFKVEDVELSIPSALVVVLKRAHTADEVMTWTDYSKTAVRKISIGTLNPDDRLSLRAWLYYFPSPAISIALTHRTGRGKIRTYRPAAGVWAWLHENPFLAGMGLLAFALLSHWLFQFLNWIAAQFGWFGWVVQVSPLTK